MHILIKYANLCVHSRCVLNVCKVGMRHLCTCTVCGMYGHVLYCGSYLYTVHMRLDVANKDRENRQ